MDSIRLKPVSDSWCAKHYAGRVLGSECEVSVYVNGDGHFAECILAYPGDGFVWRYTSKDRRLGRPGWRNEDDMTFSKNLFEMILKSVGFAV